MYQNNDEMNSKQFSIDEFSWNWKIQLKFEAKKLSHHSNKQSGTMNARQNVLCLA